MGRSPQPHHGAGFGVEVTVVERGGGQVSEQGGGLSEHRRRGLPFIEAGSVDDENAGRKITALKVLEVACESLQDGTGELIGKSREQRSVQQCRWKASVMRPLERSANAHLEGRLQSRTGYETATHQRAWCHSAEAAQDLDQHPDRALLSRRSGGGLRSVQSFDHRVPGAVVVFPNGRTPVPLDFDHDHRGSKLLILRHHGPNSSN